MKLLGIFSRFLAVAAIAAFAAMIPACQTPGGKALSAGLNAAFNSPAGAKALADLGNLSDQATAAALAAAASKLTGVKGASVTSSLATTVWTSSNIVTTAADLTALVSESPTIAKAAADAFNSATANGAQSSATANAIAAVISTGAGAPPLPAK